MQLDLLSKRRKMLMWSNVSLFCLSIDSADEDTEGHAADNPGQIQEDSRHWILCKTQKSELKMLIFNE